MKFIYNSNVLCHHEIYSVILYWKFINFYVTTNLILCHILIYEVLQNH